MLEYEVAEGLESSLTINVAGTFLLAFLLPKLRQVAQTFETKPNLVVVGSEVAFGMKGQLEKVDGDLFDSLTESAKASMANRYQTTKLLQCYAVRELAKIESQAGSDIIVNIVNPGLCKTELARRAGPLLTVIFNIFKFLVARTSEMGSRTLLHATSAGPESHGKYLSACRVQEHVVPEWVTNDGGRAMQKRVWADLSRRLDSIQPGAVEACFPA